MFELEFEWDLEKEQENIRERRRNYPYNFGRVKPKVAEPFELRIYHGSSEIYGWQRVNP